MENKEAALLLVLLIQSLTMVQTKLQKINQDGEKTVAKNFKALFTTTFRNKQLPHQNCDLIKFIIGYSF